MLCLGEAIYKYLLKNLIFINICKEVLHFTIALVRPFNMYLYAKTLSKYSKRFESYSDFHKLITDDGHVSARLFIKKSGILQFHWLDLANIYPHAKRFSQTDNGRTW